VHLDYYHLTRTPA